ncbi:GDP-mannose dehydrogenase [Geoanaerobacter pelophilus]|uniref:GDP-mannose dehydrogenase n=1 Tax=Geoanaerobacter pelophilus TaxID=60036 RepID=A0ABQ0MFX0_9BACT|nr:GDP-mannose dehydrogenase [Geoanaerobacter pelophilus]
MTVERIVSVVGLGYVGLPVAVAFGKVRRTIGFDINRTRIKELREGHDRTAEVAAGDLAQADILFTDRIEDLRQANFHIVAVPTPIDEANQPDLSLVCLASETVGKALKPGDIVVYESTVYPGVTEDECIPVLERVSGLKGGSTSRWATARSGSTRATRSTPSPRSRRWSPARTGRPWRWWRRSTARW